MENKLELTPIAKRVYKKNETAAIVIINIVTLALAIASIVFGVLYFDFLCWVGAFFIVLLLILDICHVVSVHKNHSAPEFTIMLREDDKIVLYYQNWTKDYVNVEDIYNIKSKPHITSIITPYYYSISTMNYGKVIIYARDERGRKEKFVVDDVLKCDEACVALWDIVCPDEDEDEIYYDN